MPNITCIPCVGVSVDCSCVDVSTQYSASYSGRYYQTPATGGRPTYKHALCSQYLYFLDAERQVWAFGPEVGGTRAYIVGDDLADTPLDVNATWRVHDKTYPAWFDDDQFSIACTCPGKL